MLKERKPATPQQELWSYYAHTKEKRAIEIKKRKRKTTSIMLLTDGSVKNEFSKQFLAFYLKG